DASLGLCQCEKDDWRSLENEQWSFVMSPYEQLFVDVKFARGTDGFVSVYLHEVSQGWRYVLLAIGFSLLFLAPVASKCLPSDYSSTVRVLAVRAIAITFIYQSSMDTLFAMVAVVTCLTVYILIRFINDPVTWEKWKLKRLRGRELTKVRSGETVKAWLLTVLGINSHVGKLKLCRLVGGLLSSSLSLVVFPYTTSLSESPLKGSVVYCPKTLVSWINGSGGTEEKVLWNIVIKEFYGAGDGFNLPANELVTG
ncbi:hypothetical protein Tco_1393918, partial [Tanacetum coccineum]